MTKKKKIELIAMEIMGWTKPTNPWAKKYGYWDDNGTTLCNKFDPFDLRIWCDDAWHKVQESHESWLHCDVHTKTGWHGSKRNKCRYEKETSRVYTAEIIFRGDSIRAEHEDARIAMIECMLDFIIAQDKG